jgi:DNA-3-methyladenine glycosylase I
MVILYAGFKAATVTAKAEVSHKHFPDHESVADYSEDQVSRILEDAETTRNPRKIRACVSNARRFRSTVKEYGSFQNYVDSFGPTASFENLILLKEELEHRLDGLGRVTTYQIVPKTNASRSPSPS